MSSVPLAAAAAADQRLRCRSVRLFTSRSRAVTTRKAALKRPICTRS